MSAFDPGAASEYHLRHASRHVAPIVVCLWTSIRVRVVGAAGTTTVRAHQGDLSLSCARRWKQGRLTSRLQLVEMYLAQAGDLPEQMLKAAIYVNANALKEAEALDRERAAGRVRGPLHGIPIALKDNIYTTNMPT